jgi:hypothetical protein
MVILLILFLLIQVLGQTQNQIDANAAAPDIEVGKFSWAHHRGTGTENSNSRSMTTNPVSRKFLYKREIENRNSIENRSRDMREMEENVLRERADTKPIDLYRYKIELRNRGSKVIKWVFLDYQTSHPSDPDNPFHREFACAVKIKPNDNRSLVAESLLPPSRVTNAAGKEATLTEKLIINRIEYADGAIWERPDWHAPDDIPSRSSSRGPCRPLDVRQSSIKRHPVRT